MIFGVNMEQKIQIIKEVNETYRWVDEQVAQFDRSCKACGDCCDLETFGHRLYVTGPELLHFQHFVGSEIKEMAGGVCPYRVDGKCSVYPYRFSGCRIFACGGDSQQESQLSEQTISKFKGLCTMHNIPYRYVYLKVGLEMLREASF